jgi:hypothetical protein
VAKDVSDRPAQQWPVVGWFQRYRLLIVIYVLAISFGVREFMVLRTYDPVDVFTEEWARMTEIQAEINPGQGDTEFLLALQAIQRGDEEEGVRLMEAALNTGIKHNDFLLQSYAQQLLNRGANHELVNLAVNRWRQNHPTSPETIWLSLSRGPQNPQEEAVLGEALEDVPWISRVELERAQDATGDRWRAIISFDAGKEIDMREAVAAASILLVPPQERSRMRVVCMSFENCTLLPMPR